jgi:hypothetical protein
MKREFACFRGKCENSLLMCRRSEMKAILFAAVVLLVLPSVTKAAQAAVPAISGDYVEFRNADVYTGPCFANSEMGLTGDDAVLAWHVREGVWAGVPLRELSVVAVVRASATLGDLSENPLPVKTLFLVDERANDAQRAALVEFAQAQAPGLLNDVLAIQAQPISFSIARHGWTTVQAGNLLHLATRALVESDQICHNEVVYYPPLAQHLAHSLPVVAESCSYTGNSLGVTWNDSGRRSSFVGSFAE